MKKFFNFFQYFAATLAFICSLCFIFFTISYEKIDKDKIPAFVIQQGKLSNKQIADLTKLSDAKNIWVINDNEDFNRATELIKQSADAISYANQVGRLDLVSILLGIIAIIFGFVGIVGFLHIKTMVEAQIDQAIKEEFKEDGNARKLIKNETNIFLSNRINAYDSESDIKKIFEENNK